MTDKKGTIETKKRAHRETIDYLEKKKIALTLQLQKNRREISYLANDQKTFKKGIFYLINLIRLQNGSKPYVWNNKKRKVIRKPKSKNIIFSEFAVVTYGKNHPEFLGTFMKKENANKIKKALMRIDNPAYPVKVHKVRIILID